MLIIVIAGAQPGRERRRRELRAVVAAGPADVQAEEQRHRRILRPPVRAAARRRPELSASLPAGAERQEEGGPAPQEEGRRRRPSEPPVETVTVAAEGSQGAQDSGHRRFRRPAASPGASIRRLPTSRSSPSSTSPTTLRVWCATTATTGTSSFPRSSTTRSPTSSSCMFGANDRQQMRDRQASGCAVRSESWEKTYVQRIDGMVDTLKVYGRPFFWVSAPPMRQRRPSRRHGLSQRALQGRASKAAGGTLRRHLERLHRRGRPVHLLGSRRRRPDCARCAPRRHQLHPRRPAEARLLCRARDPPEDRHRRRRDRPPRLDQPARARSRSGRTARSGWSVRSSRSRTRCRGRATRSPARRSRWSTIRRRER